MIRAWRISSVKFAGNAFDGEGPRVNGGRWNSPGVRVSYSAESLSLATLEVLVRLLSQAILKDYTVLTIDFPLETAMEVDVTTLPANWRASPPPETLQAIGNAWVESGRSLILRVPSAVIPVDHNYLINPSHPDFARVVIGNPTPLDIDPRVLRPLGAS